MKFPQISRQPISKLQAIKAAKNFVGKLILYVLVIGLAFVFL